MSCLNVKTVENTFIVDHTWSIAITAIVENKSIVHVVHPTYTHLGV